MKQGLFNSFSVMGVCRNIQFIVSDTLQRIKKLQIQAERIWLEELTFCKRGRLQIGYGEKLIWHMSTNGFRAEYRGETVMFTKTECRLLSAPYFRLIRQTDTFYEIQSQNTGHFWIIKKTQITQQNPIIIYHKHTQGTPYYHKHGKARNIQSALRQIKSHDVYQMNGRQAVRQ